MEANICLKREDGGVVYVRISELGNLRMMELKQSLLHMEYVRLKETILLNQFKHSIKKDRDDPMGDLRLFKREMTRYFKSQKTPVMEDSLAV